MLDILQQLNTLVNNQGNVVVDGKSPCYIPGVAINKKDGEIYLTVFGGILHNHKVGYRSGKFQYHLDLLEIDPKPSTLIALEGMKINGFINLLTSLYHSGLTSKEFDHLIKLIK